MKVEVQEDSAGELIIEFPDELMDELGWKAGDTLHWHEDNGKWVITKENNNEQ